MTAIEADITIGNCRMILGDMREVLPLLDERADMAMSDPPYRLTSGGRNGEMGGCFSKDGYDNSGELFAIVEWADMAPLIFAALADNADAVIMTNDREEATARMAFMGAGFGFHRLLVWNKGTATPNRYYMPDCEFGLYLYKGRARTINDCGSKQSIRLPHRDETDHPTEKPVPLMAHWIRNSTDRGDLVLDPFMGSGSTIVAAAQTGRRAIGIEKDPRFFQIACDRVRRARFQPGLNLSEKSPAQAVQEGFAL